MKKIALAGSSLLARRLIYQIKETGYGRVAGMFDDFEEKGTVKYEHPVLGTLDDIAKFYQKGGFDEIFIAIGYKHLAFRKRLFSTLKEQAIPIGTFVHPSSYVAKSASVSEGCIVLINSIIEMNSVLYENVFLSSSCYISHDVIVGAHTYCAPSLNIAGFTKIGECCFLGISTTTIDGVSIGGNVRTGAGSVITKDVPANVLVAGVPAQVKKELSK